MESNTFMMPSISGKSILRSTGEEVEIIDFEAKERGDRTNEDWVTYIDSEGKEHIKEHLNIQLDFKAVVNDAFNKVFDFATKNKYPTERNKRIFEVAKELVINHGYKIEVAINRATELVDEILASNNIRLANNRLHDYVFVANMAKADYMGEEGCLENDQQLARYIKNVIDDPDAKEGVTFARWLATMAVNGIEIDWSDILDHS